MKIKDEFFIICFLLVGCHRVWSLKTEPHHEPVLALLRVTTQWDLSSIRKIHHTHVYHSSIRDSRAMESAVVLPGGRDIAMYVVQP